MLTSSTLIHHIATTSIDNIIESGVHKVSLSDLNVVFCKRKLNGAVGVGDKLVTTRNMKNFNEKSFLTDISNFCWEELVYRTHNTDTMVCDWSPMFSVTIENHSPIRETRISVKNSPWVCSELKSLMKSRDKRKKAALKHKFPAMISCYNEARNTVKSLDVLLIKNYFASKIVELKSNIKETLKVTNELLNKRNKSKNIASFKNGDDEIEEKKENSKTMKRYFCSGRRGAT